MADCETNASSSLLLQFMDEDGVIDLVGYQQQQGSKKRKRNDHGTALLSSVPQLLSGSVPADAKLLQAIYSTFYILHMSSPEFPSQISPHNTPATPVTWKSIQAIFESLDPTDQESWCVETEGDRILTPKEFLQPKVTQDQGYCSFLERHQVLQSPGKWLLPLQQIVPEWSHGDCTWIFFGRNVGRGRTNSENSIVLGRPEHTDAVSHDGTWHYQLSGRKTWYLRPTPELIDLVQYSTDAANSSKVLDPALVLEVTCQEGDVLVVNTRLWWHRTEIPLQHVPSVSYARDFFFSKEKREQSNMSNVDGMYATTDIEEGTIVLREEDVPDCELHRSKENPNCEVVLLEDDVYAVVSIRPIKAGEFFCIAESDEESDEKEEDWSEDEE